MEVTNRVRYVEFRQPLYNSSSVKCLHKVLISWFSNMDIDRLNLQENKDVGEESRQVSSHKRQWNSQGLIRSHCCFYIQSSELEVELVELSMFHFQV